MNLSVIIVAAGRSERMGFDKLLAKLGGKCVLQWSIEAFTSHSKVSEVIVVCPRERFDTLSSIAKMDILTRIDGGNDRHDSVASGLSALTCRDQYVAVHDAARPLISTEQIDRVLHAATEHGAAASARPVTETVKRADTDAFVTESLCRDDLWLMETPQIFKTELLTRAYEMVQKSGQRVTDEVSAMQLIDRKTILVANKGPNLKITYPEDISLAEKLLS